QGLVHSVFLIRYVGPIHMCGDAYSSSSSVMPSGLWWAIPLWQSMQVMLSSRAISCCLRARCFCLSLAMLSRLWQLRHSRESLAFMRFHSRRASSRRLASNFSRVSMVPTSLPQTSLEASILRIILYVHSLGTWQSEQTARTPVRFV